MTSLLRSASCAVACAIALQGTVARADEPAHVPRSRIESEIPDLAVVERSRSFMLVPVRHGAFTFNEPAIMFDTLCDRAPCNVGLAPGDHQIALRDRRGTFVGATNLHLTGPALIEGRRVDRTPERVVGAILLVGGLVTGLALVAAGVQDQNGCSAPGCSPSKETEGKTLVAAGVGTALGGLLIGGLLACTPDTVSFAVSPLIVPVGSARGRESNGLASLAPTGLTLTMRF